MKKGRTDRDWLIVATMAFFAGAFLVWALMSRPPSGHNPPANIDWPAWVQAVGSVAAIIAAGLFPLLHSWVRRREVTQSLIELVSYARFPATLMIGQFEGTFGGPRLIRAHLDQLHRAFDSVSYVDIPDRTLAVGVQQAATAVIALKQIQELFLNKGEMDKERGIKLVQKYISMIDGAVNDAIDATGQKPRNFGYAARSLPNE